MGVRSSRELKSFPCPQPEEPKVLETFLASHQTLDQEIQRVAESLLKGKEAA